MENENKSEKQDLPVTGTVENPFSVDVESISTDDYIKSTIEAGDRVRKLIYILCFSSIISLMGFWNASNKSWINDRFDTVFEADEHYAKEGVSLLDKFPCKQSKADATRIHDFLDQHEINSVAKLKAYEKIFTDLRESIYSIKVPILGINFDINDLGIFSGLTFGFLLLLLALSIEREEENLLMTFSYSRENKIIGRIYTYLAMGQVLADPPRPHLIGHRKSWLRRNITKGLFLVPIVAHTTILLNDILTFSSGAVLNKYSSFWALIVSGLLWLLNIRIAYSCIRREMRIDEIWKNFSLMVSDTEIKQIGPAAK